LKLHLFLIHNIQDGPQKSSPPSALHLHLAAVLISVFMLCYGPRLLFRGPLCI